ncbi:hypothetical protein CA984_27120 [Streptosporangium minutum]|uniref:Uncharacterized protein n=1 Tax=Streptosporangium minutum TaxID=569862 RepID=A0A243REU8_9ACTN|nr:hypothetical protein CA984_27120 [Streptosporangium minutum]
MVLRSRTCPPPPGGGAYAGPSYGAEASGQPGDPNSVQAPDPRPGPRTGPVPGLWIRPAPDPRARSRRCLSLRRTCGPSRLIGHAQVDRRRRRAARRRRRSGVPVAGRREGRPASGLLPG